jgi:hypothetical protein
MPGVRGLFRVMEKHEFVGKPGMRMVRLESTQITNDIFAGRLDLMIANPQMGATFEMGALVTVDVVPVPRNPELPL